MEIDGVWQKQILPREGAEYNLRSENEVVQIGSSFLCLKSHLPVEVFNFSFYFQVTSSRQKEKALSIDTAFISPHPTPSITETDSHFQKEFY